MVNEAALETVEKLASAAGEGDLDKVKSACKLLENKSDVNLYNMKGLTALNFAAYFGHDEVVSYLLKVRLSVFIFLHF